LRLGLRSLSVSLQVVCRSLETEVKQVSPFFPTPNEPLIQNREHPVEYRRNNSSDSASYSAQYDYVFFCHLAGATAIASILGAMLGNLLFTLLIQWGESLESIYLHRFNG
jgi:hypothetical protein